MILMKRLVYSDNRGRMRSGDSLDPSGVYVAKSGLLGDDNRCYSFYGK